MQKTDTDTLKSTHNNITWVKVYYCYMSNLVAHSYFVLSLVLVLLLMSKVLVQFPYVASPVPSWLADRSTLSGRWVRTEWASCRLLNSLLCWLGQAHPFCFRQWVCGRGLGREGACVPQLCARACGIVSSPFILHTHAQREAVRHHNVLVWPGKLEVHAWTALSQLVSERNDIRPYFFFFFLFFLRHHTKVYA